jgi:hypothetical protein
MLKQLKRKSRPDGRDLGEVLLAMLTNFSGEFRGTEWTNPAYLHECIYAALCPALVFMVGNLHSDADKRRTEMKAVADSLIDCMDKVADTPTD